LVSAGELRTLWGAFSKRTAVLRIAPTRGKEHLHALLGDEFAGIVGSDRFVAYNSLDPAKRQVCWSHLRRDFTFHADLGLGPQEAFGLDGLEITWDVFQAWKQFQEDGDRAALQERVDGCRRLREPPRTSGSPHSLRTEPRLSQPLQPGQGDSGDWGREEYAQALLGEDFALEFEEGDAPVTGASGEAVWQLVLEASGPFKARAASLELERREQFHREFVDLLESHREGDQIELPAPYLVVLGTRRSVSM